MIRLFFVRYTKSAGIYPPAFITTYLKTDTKCAIHNSFTLNGRAEIVRVIEELAPKPQ